MDSHWIKGNYQPHSDRQDRELASGVKPQILYWWPSIISSDNSAQIGRKMLIGTIAWIAILILAVLLLGTINAMS